MKRRKVSNLLGLAVLSSLMERPMHPYEVASVLRARGKEADMEIKIGSLYTVVGNLARHGFIEVAESGREGALPERTVYRITDAGREELLDWVRELISTPQAEPRRFKAGLSVFAVVGPDQAAALLRERLAALEQGTEALRAAAAEHAAFVPRLFLVEDEYEIAMREAEQAWVRALLEELTSGSFPGLAEWRAWETTGQAPAATPGPKDRGAPPAN
ncbi:PadR family transcriptional regulator [Streptomyces sp. R44]|uniref:PadR family transcriptional regulator n=1 Tax=Streptomyces sp. R44 TaxID=3238633 RepID=A0AB39SPQ0_9ACTN